MMRAALALALASLAAAAPAAQGASSKTDTYKAFKEAKQAMKLAKRALAKASAAEKKAGLAGAPGTPGPSGAATGYTAGQGLLLSGGAFSVDPTFVQRRVSTACAAGSALRAIAQDGTATCQSTAVQAPLTLSGNTFAPTGIINATNTNTSAGAPAIVGTSGTFSEGVGVKGIGGPGVLGEANTGNFGVLGRGGDGVRGETTSVGGAGIVGVAGAATSWAGYFAGRVRVSDRNADTNGGALIVDNDTYNGVAIKATGLRHGVSALGGSPETAALYARNDNGGRAADFAGNVHVAGSLSKASGTFLIDHPLDPANKYLAHSFVESPEMLNLYTGVVRSDRRGRATVRMPEWFDALNRTFTYQLTVIGSPARAWVGREIEANAFTVRTTAPRTKLSWMVTGVREDAYAERNRVEVETPKAPADRGRYLYPEGFGRSQERAIAP